MNLRQGRIGRQEALCAAAIAAGASAVFTTDTNALYARGNSAYLSTPLSALLSLGAFLLVVRTMQRRDNKNLWELLSDGLGPVFGRVAALICTAVLLFAAAGLLSRFSLMLGRFVFPDASEWQILAYLAAAAFVPAWLGLEGIGRTSRLFVWLLLIAVLGALLLAAYNYQPHRLAPFLGDGLGNMAELSVRDTALFFPALMGLLVVTRGVHGVTAAKRAGYGAGIAAGVLSSLCQICLGMTYSYHDLAQMHSPMYRLTMNFRSGGYYPRLDLLLMMGWTLSGTLGAGFYTYAAALLFAEAFQQEDIRPAVAAFTAAVGGTAMLMHVETDFTKALGDIVSRYGWLAATVPALLAAALAARKGKREGKAGEDE